MADATTRRRPLGTRQEVAEYLGVPVATLTAWAYRGIGPKYHRVGRHVRYHWADIETWLNQRTAGGGPAA